MMSFNRHTLARNCMLERHVFFHLTSFINYQPNLEAKLIFSLRPIVGGAFLSPGGRLIYAILLILFICTCI